MEETSRRGELPQLSGDLFLTDGGLETSLIFHRGIDLPAFAAFDLLKSEQGNMEIRRYFEPYLELAKENDAGFVLESPTWRASPRWADEIGYSQEELDQFNRRAIALMAELRDRHQSDVSPIVISGCIGPQDDGYNPTQRLSAAEAADYHSTQIGTFADTEADLVTAMTMTYADEGIGVTRAAQEAGMPVVIAFTTETDGRLPSGQPLGEAIEETDAATGGGPAYYMINCAHPTHFESVLDPEASWAERIRSLRANASTRSHAELDEAEDLDDGDPADLGARYAALRERLPNLNVVGGCCGTDDRHVAQICSAWLQPAA
jgi:S-methylmethionine-dependent homocysteine/selenocysteine methylase